MNMSSPMLPPGFRFHPTDQELIIYYLKKKVSSFPNPVVSIIADVDIYKFNPWELPGKAWFGESEWFFFSPRDRKYPNGARPNRAAACGYWKATGTDKPIMSSSGGQCLGVKKALSFYQGRPPKGVKTNWMMLEYRLIDTSWSPRLRGSMRLDDWVLCRVRQKRKTFQRMKGHYDANCSSSPFTSGYLQGQEIMNKNDPMQYSHYDHLQAYNHLLALLEIEEADHEQGQVESQAGSTPEYSVSDFDSNSNMVSSNRSILESIKKVLSIGALDELVPPLQPNASTCTYKENESNFQVPSPITSASNPPCFAEFTI